MSLSVQQELENEYVMHTFGRKPLELVEGLGMKVRDDKGAEYLDFIGGIGADSLGHCHPKLVAALQAQAARLIHVSNYYYIEGRGEVARLLSDMLNACEIEAACKSETACEIEAACKSETACEPKTARAPESKCGSDPKRAPESKCESDPKRAPESKREPWQTFFANSGAEANECAIKLARLYARKQAEAAGHTPHQAPRLVLTLDKSFHGRTLATLAATAQPSKQELFEPLPDGFLRTPQNDIAALEMVFSQMGNQICAVMLECVQGESGVHPCTKEFLQAVRRLTEQYGALLICDEVQCGIYRCGTWPFAFQHFDITPDIVSIAKGVASGFPMGACAAREEVARAFQPGDHGSTFGGSNLAIAAAHATLTELGSNGMAEHIAQVGAYLQQRLAELPHVVEVRGLGLMVAADLDDAAPLAPDVVQAALSVGLLLNSTGPHTLRFLPPLVCQADDVDTLVVKLAALLE